MTRRKIAPRVRVKEDASKKLRFRVYYRDGGRVVYLSSHSTKTGKDGYLTAVKQAQDQLDEEYGQTGEQAGVGGFSDHLEAFYRYCEKMQLAPATMDFYRQKLAYLSGKLGRARLKDLDKERVKLAIKAAANSPTWERGVLRALSAYLNWGYAESPPLCPPSFTRFVKLDNPKEKRHKNFFTVEECEQLMQRCRDDWRRWPMAMKLFAGIRTEELNRMTWELVDFETRSIYIPEGIGKTAGHMEDLPEALWRWIEKRPPADKRSSEGRERHAGKVCLGNSEDIVKNLKRYLPLDEAKGATCRRTFATYACNAYGVEKARKWMRHDDKLTTMERNYLGCVTYRSGKPYIATKATSESFFTL